MRRLMMLLTVALVMAAMMVASAMPALAAKPDPDWNCTYKKGKTTCVNGPTLTNSYEGQEYAGISYERSCPTGGTQTVSLYDDFAYSEYTTITTVYAGRSDRVLSTHPETFTVRQHMGQHWEYSECV
jgi:hypothetical protein